MLRLVFVLACLAMSTPLASAQAPLDAPTQERLRLELREMMAADQRVRYMTMFGTFSPCEADSIAALLADLDAADYFARRQELEAEAEARLSQAERDVLLARQQATDAANIERLRAIVDAYGWPDSTRIGGSTNPFVFLLHAHPDTLDAMLPVLRREVDAGRMPPLQYARAVDKQRKIRGALQLYGSGEEFDPETRSLMPPRIADIEATNAARAAIGLPPLEAYRLASED